MQIYCIAMRYYLVVLLLLLVSCNKMNPSAEQTFVAPPTAPAAVLPNEVTGIKISFSDYVNHPTDYADKNLVLVGHLRTGLATGDTTGATQYFLVDDYGIRIRLRNYEPYTNLFSMPGNTTYLVNGTWQKEYYGYGLFVNRID